MILQKFKIENFRSIKAECFDLSQLCVLVGANDHGKTNVMRAINAFFNIKIDDSLMLEEGAFYRSNKRRDSGSAPMRLSALIGNLPAGLLHTKRKLNQVAISMQFYSDGTVRFSFNSNDLDSPSNRNNPKAFSKYKEIIRNFKVSYVPTFRNIEDQLSPFAKKSVLFEMLSEYLYESVERTHGGKTFEYRKIRKIKGEIDNLLSESFNEIRESSQKYLPTAYGKADFSFSFIGSKNDELRDRILSEIISKNTYILNSNNGSRINELGSGIQQAVTIGLLEKTCISKNRSNILLLEEPESFLHPNAQRELFLKLSGLSKRPSTQLICSTHSSAILDATELDKICVVRKTKDTTDGDLTHILQIQNLNQAVTRKTIDEVELKKTFENSDVFFSELVVLVEGFSDELVIKEVLKKLAPDLMYRVSIVSCNGNSKFPAVIKLLDSFKSRFGMKIKWGVITDKDSLLKEVLKDFKSFPTKQVINWDEVVKLAKKKIQKNSNENLNLTSLKLISNKINRATSSASIYVLQADIEFSIVNSKSILKASQQIKKFDSRGEATLNRYQGYERVANLIGSKGPNLDWQIEESNKKKWKKAELHRAIVSSCDNDELSDEFNSIINWLRALLQS